MGCLRQGEDIEMNKKHLLFISLFLLIGFLTGHAENKYIAELQPDFDSLVTSGIKQIYNIKFSEAKSTFDLLSVKYPDHPAGKFFLAMIDWWKILLDPDSEQYDDLFIKKLDGVINQCDKILDKDPNNFEALFFKGGALGFRGRLHSFRESWLKAASDAKEAMPMLGDAYKVKPQNIDLRFGFGIYDYYAEVIPGKYPFIKPLMFFLPKGDKEKGIKELNYAADKGKFTKYEARYFLMSIYYNYENNPYKADEYADELIKDFPDNPVFERWKGRIMAKEGNNLVAATYFSDILEKANGNMPGYNYPSVRREASYYVGLHLKNVGKLDSAKYYFNTCAKLSKQLDKDEESGFLINSYLYLGMINDLQGKREDAISDYKLLLDMKNYGKSHELAKEYLKTPYKN